jgi:mannose-6-phosphate isomerase-like protein (cupin superfamily)
MKMRRYLGGLGILAAFVCVSIPESVPAQPPVNHGAAILNIDSLLSVFVLHDEQQIRTDMVSSDSLTSIQLTQVRGGVESHKHLVHHETVWIVRGAGRLVLGDIKQKVSAGEVINIPPGVSHSFHNLGVVPTVVISVFSPAFDGKDRVYDNSKK